MRTTRRDFIKMSGCLSIGFTLGNFSFDHPSPLVQELPGSLKSNPHINSWLEVLANGRIRIFTGKLELGQGIRTAIAQVAAEELNLPIEKTEVILADTERTPNEGYTAGSGSIEGSAMAVRFAAAAAKAKLLELAARKWKVAVDELDTSNGTVHTKNRKQQTTFGALLLGKQITDEVKLPVTLKPKEKYALVGKAIPRADISRMVVGKLGYLHDLRFDDMVHARVVRPTAYAATLVDYDEEHVKKNVPGMLKIVRNGSFLGVITEDEYQAVAAQRLLRLNSTWKQTTNLPTAKLRDYLKQLLAQSENVMEKGNAGTANFTHHAEYFKPYIMHGSMGPSCAVALWNNDKLHIWSHTQGVFPLRDAIVGLLHLPEEKVEVTGVPGSGCYGHNGADDVAADAAVLAMAYPGRHVRLQWMREDEHLWEPYGSAMIMEASAALDGNGKITRWKYDVWTDTHSTRPGGNAENLLVARYLEKPLVSDSAGFRGGGYRNAEPYYVFTNQRVDAHFFKAPLRVSALRSLGAYANIFAIESFMDELSVKAKKDPFDFRIMHLDDERAIAVVEKLKQMVAGEKPEKGSAIGMAFSRYKNHASYCAVAALVAVDAQQHAVQVKKMWGVIDCGEAINIDGVINQTEGGMIQSASWTLGEEVKFDETHVNTGSWDTYPIFRFSDAPEVHVEVLNRPHEEVLGAGEAAQGPAAAAVVNAVYRASGIRVRELPVRGKI